jgi:hypothetical protein
VPSTTSRTTPPTTSATPSSAVTSAAVTRERGGASVPGVGGVPDTVDRVGGTVLYEPSTTPGPTADGPALR